MRLLFYFLLSATLSEADQLETSRRFLSQGDLNQAKKSLEQVSNKSSAWALLR